MARILVVDDDPDILALVESTLESSGHQPVATSDPRKALMLAVRERADAIVLDLVMAELSGWDVLELLRRDPVTHDLPVVLLSVVGDTATRIRGLRAGANDFVVKPFDPDELVVRLEGLLVRRGQASVSLQGVLESHPVADVVQTLEHGGKTGELQILGPEGPGRVELVGGLVVAAEVSSLRDHEALLALLERKAGSFYFHARSSDDGAPPAQPGLSPHRAVLEAAWTADELARRRHLLPTDGETVAATGQPPGKPPAALTGLPVADVLAALAPRGATLDALLDRWLAAPNRVRLTLAWLIETGAVAVKGSSG